MLKKENKLALLLILGLCITWLGNFEAEAKVLVEPNYGSPGFFQHAYSVNRAKRESDTSETDQYVDVDEYDDQSTTNITDQHSQINKDNDEDAELPDENAELPDEGAELPYEGAELPDKHPVLFVKGANPPDEDFGFPKTEKQTYWNYEYEHAMVNIPEPDNENDTEYTPLYGSKRVKIEIPPDFNARSSALTNKGNVVLKWHVGIYTKTTTPYMQICGGTLVTLDYVISAAHCFWHDKRALPAEHFAIGAGKLYRPWFDTHETYSQTSDVSAIHIPSRYRGSWTNFQDDIALVKLSLSLTASSAVLPACVSFDESLDEEQLSNRKAGTVMGWGLTQQDGKPSQVLNYVEVPPLPVDECFNQASSEFFKYITSDKICAGVTGQGLCLGDSGGGLVFLDDSWPPVPYLRGVASTAPNNGHACNTATFTTFTHVFHHRVFLRKHLPLLERDCQRHYEAAIVENKNSCPRVKSFKPTLFSRKYGTAECECNITTSSTTAKFGCIEL